MQREISVANSAHRPLHCFGQPSARVKQHPWPSVAGSTDELWPAIVWLIGVAAKRFFRFCAISLTVAPSVGVGGRGANQIDWSLFLQ